MKWFKSTAFAVIIGLIFSIQFTTAQTASQREWTIFEKGVSDYKQGHYEKAAENFQLVISKLPNSPLITANYLMLAKTLYKQKQYVKSADICNEFVKKFPASSYLGNVYFLLGNNYYRLDRNTTAVMNWIKAAESSTDPKLEKMALTNVEGMIAYHLDEDDLTLLKNEADNDFAKQIVHYNIAQRYYQSGKPSKAIEELNAIINKTDKETYHHDRAVKLLARIENRPLEGGIRIAALLPLSGSNQDVGRSLLDGVKLAIKDFNAINSAKIDLVVYDYETRLSTAVEKIKEIAEDESIVAVYGPVENDAVTACAAISEYEELPVFSPTASGANLTTLSSYFIQLAPPVDARAKILAKYAIDSLKLKRVATLSPIEDYFTTLTKEFCETFKENGADIPVQQWYYPGDQDFKLQFKAIKRHGLRISFADSLSKKDSTLIQAQIDSLYYTQLKHEQFLLRDTNMEVDSADIPVYAFDGLFMPIYQDDLSSLASQYAYWNIQAQLLGNEDWYNPEELKKNKNYINGLIFLSDGYLNEESWDYRQFRNRFRVELNKTPERFEFLGFDSFNFILSVIDNKSLELSRRDILRSIQNRALYKGIYSNYFVGKKRYNNAVRLLKYVYGQIIPLN
ncbi:MAG: penicillin-binding protein activator [Calditrichaceae bacterium]|nr:penicillin-binding protein activator [Calditrichaceae bacterium]